MAGRPLRLLIYGGDNMLGRAVNLTLPHQSPGDELVADSCTAQHYLERALHGGERQAGELQRIREENRDGSRLWGDLLRLELDPPPDLSLLNLETAVTETIANRDVPRKSINYHMHSGNLAAFTSLATVRHGAPADVPYVVSFANNHSMDFGRQAFERESLPRLRALPGRGHVVGAGLNFAEACRPAVISVRGTPVRILGFAAACAGTPWSWAALEGRSGLVWLPGISGADSADRAFEICRHAVAAAGAGGPENGLLVLSIHWGPNWAYRQPGDGQEHRRRLAHRLVDELGADVIYGHSSHHARGLEVHSGKLILYGAGDLVNDYEGFQNPGDEAYSSLGGIFVVDLEPGTGRVLAVYVVPMAMDRLALRRVTQGSSLWDPLHGVRRPSSGAVDDLAQRLNALSALDAADPAAVPDLSLRLDSEAVGILPSGPILAWQRADGPYSTGGLPHA